MIYYDDITHKLYNYGCLMISLGEKNAQFFYDHSHNPSGPSWYPQEIWDPRPPIFSEKLKSPAVLEKSTVKILRFLLKFPKILDHPRHQTPPGKGLPV